MNYTIILVAITALTSIAAFSNDTLYNKLILWPKAMTNPVEYYRLLTSGFIHADWNHLIFNMFTFFIFGSAIESDMGLHQQFVLLYVSAIVVASIPTFLKNRHNSYYRSLGASGGVAAVVFFNIYFFPWRGMQIMFIPINIPSIVMGVLFLAYEAYMDRRGRSNINHNAHLWGSIYGLVFAFCIDNSHGADFMYQVMHPQVHF